MQDIDTSAGAEPASKNITLTNAIDNYMQGLESFKFINEDDWPNHGGEDAVIAKTYGSPLQVLSSWEGNARNLSEALAALELCAAENEASYASPMVGPLLKAVITFLKYLHKKQESEQTHVDFGDLYSRVRHVQSFVALTESSLVRLDEMLSGNGHALYPYEKELLGHLCQATEASVGMLDQALDVIGELEGNQIRNRVSI